MPLASLSRRFPRHDKVVRDLAHHIVRNSTDSLLQKPEIIAAHDISLRHLESAARHVLEHLAEGKLVSYTYQGDPLIGTSFDPLHGTPTIEISADAQPLLGKLTKAGYSPVQAEGKNKWVATL